MKPHFLDKSALTPEWDGLLQGRIGALDYRIKPVSEMSQFCGTSLSVDAGPRDNLAPWAALEFAIPGDTIVITTGEHLASSVVGDI